MVPWRAACGQPPFVCELNGIGSVNFVIMHAPYCVWLGLGRTLCALDRAGAVYFALEGPNIKMIEPRGLDSQFVSYGAVAVYLCSIQPLKGAGKLPIFIH